MIIVYILLGALAYFFFGSLFAIFYIWYMARRDSYTSRDLQPTTLMLIWPLVAFIWAVGGLADLTSRGFRRISAPFNKMVIEAITHNARKESKDVCNHRTRTVDRHTTYTITTESRPARED